MDSMTSRYWEEGVEQGFAAVDDGTHRLPFYSKASKETYSTSTTWGFVLLHRRGQREVHKVERILVKEEKDKEKTRDEDVAESEVVRVSPDRENQLSLDR